MTGSPHVDPERIGEVLRRLRAHSPRIHCITNTVAQTFTANVLLAAGAIPSMTISPEEVADFVGSADGLLINLGILDEERKLAIPLAIEAALSSGKPWVLDPVFVDRSPIRCSYAKSLLARKPGALRANLGEITALQGNEDLVEMARTTGAVAVLTGAQDRVNDGVREQVLGGGNPLMSRVTAMGCAEGALLAAFLAVEPDPLVAAVSCVTMFNRAGEMAGRVAVGPGSFVPAFLDALATLSPKDLNRERITA